MQKPSNCILPPCSWSECGVFSSASLHDGSHGPFKYLHARNLLLPDLRSFSVVIPVHPSCQQVVCLFWLHVWRDCTHRDMGSPVGAWPVFALIRVVLLWRQDTNHNPHQALIPDRV